MPGSPDATSAAPVGSQAAVSRTMTARLPARSWSRKMTDRPLLTPTSATFQPGSRDRTHGTSDADGTDWASSHSGSRWVQERLLVFTDVLTATWLSKTAVRFNAARTSSTTIAAHSPTRRTLHRWIRIGRGGVGSN